MPRVCGALLWNASAAAALSESVEPHGRGWEEARPVRLCKHQSAGPVTCFICGDGMGRCFHLAALGVASV